MKKYKVTLRAAFKVEAEGEDEALAKAIEALTADLDECNSGAEPWSDLFDVDVLCPICEEPLKPVYPLGDKSTGADFLDCAKCKKAFHPDTLKVVAQVV